MWWRLSCGAVYPPFLKHWTCPRMYEEHLHPSHPRNDPFDISKHVGILQAIRVQT